MKKAALAIPMLFLLASCLGPVDTATGVVYYLTHPGEFDGGGGGDGYDSTWTASTLPSSQYWKSVTHGNGVFVAVAWGSNVAATSPNGITWTASTLPSNQEWLSVTYGNGIFVAVASGSNAAATSTSP
jgi:hypothetical protein